VEFNVPKKKTLVVLPCTKIQQANRFIEHCESYKNNQVESHQIAKQVQKLIHFVYVFHSCFL